MRQKFSDEQLKALLDRGMRQNVIARELNVTSNAVSARVRALKVRNRLMSLERVDGAVSTLWNTRVAADENYQRALDLLKSERLTPADRVRVITEVRQHLQFAMDIVKTLYSTQETQAFMDEIMAVLNECEPGTRQTILKRLRNLRAVRSNDGPPG